MKKKLLNVLKTLVYLLFILLATNCKKDKENPVIMLKGEANIRIPLNTIYNEPGFTASDNIDGDLTAKVKVSDTIVPDTAGTYQIEYTVQDEEGNQASVIRNVTKFNEAEKYTGIFNGDYSIPSPGTKPVGYIDTVKISETINNQIIFRNFGGNIDANISGTIQPISIHGPIVNFSEQTNSFGTFSFNFLEDTVSTASTNKFNIYYRLTSGGNTKTGILVLNRY